MIRSFSQESFLSVRKNRHGHIICNPAYNYITFKILNSSCQICVEQHIYPIEECQVHY
jgi:hypothetical protein